MQLIVVYLSFFCYGNSKLRGSIIWLV